MHIPDSTPTQHLEIVNLHKEYEGAHLLNGVSFDVRSGETLCLLGSSGSGKSTILRIIAGIEKPDSGAVLWNGQDLVDVPVFRRNFGLMFQDYALFPHLNVAENVAFGVKMRGISKPEVVERVKEALQRVDMSGFEERRVTDLSGGEQQRIALARALAPRPGLLMLDEPLAALDRALRVDLQEELRDLLKQSGIPTVYVTHDQEEAIVVSDRLALLNNGHIVQCDRTERVFHFPATRWAAGFLGMTNFLPGKITRLDPLKVETECGIFEPHNLVQEPDLVLGEPVTLLIKPTGLDLAAEKTLSNQIAGIVKTVRFRGDHYRLEVRVGLTLVMEFTSSSALHPGQEIQIGLAKEDVILLKE